MQFHGGKASIAARLVAALEADPRVQFTSMTYVEPFVGGASILYEVMARRPQVAIANDIDGDLVEMWRLAASGEYDPPEALTLEEWRHLRKGGGTPADRAFASYGCSFGGRRWEGFAKNRRGDDFAGAARRGVLRKAARFGDVIFTAGEYQDAVSNADDLSGCVIYCDPPYDGMKPYSGMPAWDAAKFWRVMEDWVAAGAVVFVSEYSAAPAGWREVWRHEKLGSLNREDNRRPVVERLYSRM